MAAKAKAGRSSKRSRPGPEKGQAGSAHDAELLNQPDSDQAVARPGMPVDNAGQDGNPADQLDTGPSYRHEKSAISPQAPSDTTDEESMESFPASDPPARSHSTQPD